MSLRDLLNQATPGPWCTREGEPWKVDPPRVHVGTFPGIPDPNPVRAEADAALIALAPEMAELLLEAREHVTGCLGGRDCRCSECRAAIDLLARIDALGKEQTT